MTLFLTIITLLTSILGLWALLCSALNTFFFHSHDRKARKMDMKGGEKVSVIIPARNEEEKLPRLLESLTHQEYENYEVLVIDDQSTDSTWEIIEKFSRLDPRIKGYRSDRNVKLSPYGKINALLQLIPHATGDILLCTDSDTIHEPDSISMGVRFMKEGNLSILSGFPRQLTENYKGGLVTASMVFSNSILPHFILNPIQFIPFSIGIGQYVMMRRKDYEETGGYGAMPQKVCDDIGIIKHFMRNGRRYGFRNLKEYVSCTMYSDGKSAFSGIERSLTDLFPMNFPVIAGLILAVLSLLTFAWSPLLLPLFFLFSMTKEAAICISGWLLFHLGWYICAREIGLGRKISASAFLTITVICQMYVHGMYRRISGKGFEWKGRKV